MVCDGNGSSGSHDDYFDSLYKANAKQFKKEIIEGMRHGLKTLSMNQDLISFLTADLKKFKIASLIFTECMFRRTNHEPGEEGKQMIAEMIGINLDAIPSQIESLTNVIPYEMFMQYKKAKGEKEEI